MRINSNSVVEFSVWPKEIQPLCGLILLISMFKVAFIFWVILVTKKKKAHHMCSPIFSTKLNVVISIDSTEV